MATRSNDGTAGTAITEVSESAKDNCRDAVGDARPTNLWESDGVLFGLAMCAVPLSIAAAESLLASSLLFRVIALVRGHAKLCVPRVFWLWLGWASLEIMAWLHSPEALAGWGEIRHLLLIATLFLMVPALKWPGAPLAVWYGIVVAASFSSLVLIGNFLWKLFFYRGTLAPIIYLRSGGLLHHWMIYGTVEVLVFAGLLELWHFFPENHRFLSLVWAINTVAILLSLTRMLWICSLLLLALHQIWLRSRWLWAVPVIPCLLFLASPGAVRSRVLDSMRPEYYSNAERIQMLQVGWRMIREHPFTGVGAGRIDKLYTKYLSVSDPVPAYHGHLHNNIVQLAAEFGLPVTITAVLFVTVLLLDLRAQSRRATDREQQFLCRTALLGLTGFVASGMFDYTYGHSLGLILLAFAVLTPLVVPKERNSASSAFDMDQFRSSALTITDRFLSMIFVTALTPLVVAVAAGIYVLSRRSPFVAHLRIGQHGRAFWVWKLRTMWSRGAPSRCERVWLQRIAADPSRDEKLEHDPRVTSRFAAFCRRHSIDELPQLLHVIRGEMSLVGPRPVTHAELVRHYGDRAEEVLRVKPGLTGYWQTRGRNRLSYSERVQLDSTLIRELSLRVYWRTLLRTIPEVLNGKNAS